MAVRLIKKSWWVDIRFGHHRYRKRSPENSRAGAQAYEAVLRQRLARGQPFEGDPQQKKVSFSQFAQRWFEDYVVPNNKFSEQRGKNYILNASLIPFFGKTTVELVSVHQVEQYKAHLINVGVSRKTINNRLTVLGKCLGTAYEWLQLEGGPPKIKLLKCTSSRTDYLTTDACAALLGSSTGLIREMILTALRTGMRQGELKGLQWSSIDWENRVLTVRHSWCDYRKVLDSPKGNRERHIPMDRDLHDVLAKRKKSTGHVFAWRSEMPLQDNQLNKHLTAACRAAGIRRVTWHVLRHTFASQLAMKGVPLNVVQALLGHASITTTMRYAHVAPSSLRTAIDLLPSASAGALGQPVGNPWQTAHLKETA